MVYTNDFLRAFSDSIELVAMEYVMFLAKYLHTVVKNVSKEGGKLLITNRA